MAMPPRPSSPSTQSQGHVNFISYTRLQFAQLSIHPHQQNGQELTLTDPRAIMMLSCLFFALALSARDAQPGFRSQRCHGIRNQGTLALHSSTFPVCV